MVSKFYFPCCYKLFQVLFEFTCPMKATGVWPPYLKRYDSENSKLYFKTRQVSVMTDFFLLFTITIGLFIHTEQGTVNCSDDAQYSPVSVVPVCIAANMQTPILNEISLITRSVSCLCGYMPSTVLAFFSRPSGTVVLVGLMLQCCVCRLSVWNVLWLNGAS